MFGFGFLSVLDFFFFALLGELCLFALKSRRVTRFPLGSGGMDTPGMSTNFSDARTPFPIPNCTDFRPSNLRTDYKVRNTPVENNTSMSCSRREMSIVGRQADV